MNNKIEFDSKGFIDYLVFVKGNSNDLPQVTVADLEEYSRYSFAQAAATPIMPKVSWEGSLLVTSNATEEVCYSVEMVFSRLDYAVEVINKSIIADNIDPEFRELTGGNDFFEEEDGPVRFYDRLKTEVYRRLINESVYMEFTAVIADVTAIEYGKGFIDPTAVEMALAETPASYVAEVTGIPKTTVLKYQRPISDPNHRVWISDNARILGRWANNRKYGDKYDATVQ